MNRSTVIATLQDASGIPMPEVERICRDIGSDEQPWGTHDLAMVYLHLLTPELPAKDLSDIVDARLTAATISEVGGDCWTVMGEDLDRTPYTEPLDHKSLLWMLAEHIEAVALGEHNQSSYPELHLVQFCDSTNGRCVAFELRYEGLGFKKPTDCTLLYGDAALYYAERMGRLTALRGSILTALGKAMRATTNLVHTMTDEAPRPVAKTLH